MEEENDIENLFDFDNDAEDETNGGETGNENSANPSAPEGTTVAAPKRVVKNPRLKFNADRLIGERGIPVLIDHFKDVKFKGKGHEERDLDKLLATLELWTHRLFPSMKLEDNLKQIERLGHKRPVQTCVQKIRMDMPIQYGNTVNDEEDNVRRNEDFEPELDPDDAFDQLLGHQNESKPEEDTEISTSEVVNVSVPSTSGYVLGHSNDTGITEEQRKRMEYNRLLAAERRKRVSLNSSVLDSTELASATSPTTEAPVSYTSSVDLKSVSSSSSLIVQLSDDCEDSTLEPISSHSLDSTDLKTSCPGHSNSRAYSNLSVESSSGNLVIDETGTVNVHGNMSTNNNGTNVEHSELLMDVELPAVPDIPWKSETGGDLSLDDALDILDDDEEEMEVPIKKKKPNRRISSSDEEMDE